MGSGIKVEMSRPTSSRLLYPHIFKADVLALVMRPNSPGRLLTVSSARDSELRSNSICGE